MSIFFISDTHAGHKWMADRRRFSSVEEMDELMVDNWNKVVGEKDEVWHLGDVSFKYSLDTLTWLNRLNGRKHLIIGNHDRKRDLKVFGAAFDSVHYYHKLKFDKQVFILCHYPIQEWDGFYRGYYHLQGHVHQAYNSQNEGTRRMDMCVENLNYTPMHIDAVLEKLSPNPFGDELMLKR